jgi:adenosylcobyric acid synthase
MDPDGADGEHGEAQGLGLLEVDTLMASRKKVKPATGECAINGAGISGYEIHTGQTTGTDTARPMFRLDGMPDGARSANGLVEGTYLHGAFTNDAFRQAWLARAGSTADLGGAGYSAIVEHALDSLADGVEAVVNFEALLQMAQPAGWHPAS